MSKHRLHGDALKSDPRESSAWRTLSRTRLQIARTNDEPCGLCGKAIDYDLPSNARWGATVDHVTPIAWGGAHLPGIDELQPAHRRCQSVQGAAIAHLKHSKPPEPKRKTNREKTIQKDTEDAIVVAGQRPFLRTDLLHPSEIREINLYRNTGNAISGNSDNVNSINSDKQELRIRAPWDPEELPAAPPLHLSNPHPEAVGSYGEAWLDWVEREQGQTPRPWQRLVASRALEHDADGNLLWRIVVVSTPRQCGKSVLVRQICTARAAHAAQFGEEQNIVLVANNLAAARRVMSAAWSWANQAGLTVRKGIGLEYIQWPNNSFWRIIATAAIWGESATLALADEAWDLVPEIVESALLPTLVEKKQPQLWLLSTANEHPSILVPTYRGQALNGEPDVMIAEWSAPPGADLADPAVWEAATPVWSAQRHKMMKSASGNATFKYQWLNQWPMVGNGTVAPEHWPPGFEKAPQIPEIVPAGAFAAVECSPDRSEWAAAAAWQDGETIKAVVRPCRSADHAVNLVNHWAPSELVAGASITSAIPNSSPVGVKETRNGTPLLIDLVRRGLLHHNHNPETLAESLRAVASMTETGLMLSTSKSGPVPSMKALLWAVTAAANGGVTEKAEIW